MSSKQDKPKKKCVTFEPQLFRRNLCKNCFKTQAEHVANDDSSAGEEPPSPTTPTTPSTPTSPTGSWPASPLGDKPQATGRQDSNQSTSSSSSLSQPAASSTSKTEKSKHEDKPTSSSSQPAKFKPSEQQQPESNAGQVREEASVPEQHKTQQSETLAKQDDTSRPETKIPAVTVITDAAQHSNGVEVKQSEEASSDEQKNKQNTQLNSGICDKDKSDVKHSNASEDSDRVVSDTSLESSTFSDRQQVGHDVEAGSAHSIADDIPPPLTSGGRYYAGRDTYEEGETTFGATSDDEVQRNYPNIYSIEDEDHRLLDRSHRDDDGDYAISDFTNENENNLHRSQKRSQRVRQVRRRSRSKDDSDFEPNLKLHTFAMDLDRTDAMMEGTRMLIDNLRDKLQQQEDKNDHLEREKTSLQELLSIAKRECSEDKEVYKCHLHDLEDRVKQLQSEKDRLMEKMKMPESERSSLREQEREIANLVHKLDDAENRYSEALEDNDSLRNEVRDLHLEMEEMHDQFREEEALEFRELQKELEATAKNCRILQFKLRKSERRNESLESDRIQFEDKIRQMESRFEASDDKQHIQELEEELKMAKEVSVRLHDELELVEEKRARYEEELDRVNDILTESESRRRGLQKEVDSMRDEMEKLQKSVKIKRSSIKDTLDVPDRAPKLGQKGKDSSMEYDIAQLMRDLSDSLERENDLKEQLKFTEEENMITRKKISDLEEENESLTLQLQKMSTAKSSKFFKKKDIMEKEVVTEREHELRLQMELAEQELKVLRRKLDEMEEENATLLKQLLTFKSQIAGSLHSKTSKDSEELLSEDRPYDEQLQEMKGGIDKLKRKLINQDQQPRKSKLQKSKSLDEPGFGEISHGDHQDLHNQLDSVVKEISMMREKMQSLEVENEKLHNENQQLSKDSSSSKDMPKVHTDDAAMQNIDLRERAKKAESDISSLKEERKKLELKLTRLQKELTRAHSQLDPVGNMKETNVLKDKVRELERDNKALKRKVQTLDNENEKHKFEIEKSKKSKKVDPEIKEYTKMSSDELIDKIWDMIHERKSLIRMLKQKEDETISLDDDLQKQENEMKHLHESISHREGELLEEIEALEHKNAVLSNRLDLATERADRTQDELEKKLQGSDSKQTDVSKKVKDDLKKQIVKLESSLAEQQQKFQSLTKKLEKSESMKAKHADESKMFEKERDIAKQELVICKRQLVEGNEQLKDTKDRLSQLQEAHRSTRKDLSKLQEEISSHEQKLKEEKEKEEKTKKASQVSWRFEKQELEKQLKEHKKKVDDLHAELKRQQFKWKAAGEDIEKEQKLKLKMQEEIQSLKQDVTTKISLIDDLKKQLALLEESTKKDKDAWQNERNMLEGDKAAAVKEAIHKGIMIKEKDDIIKQKDEIVNEKDASLKEREEQLKDKKIQNKKLAEEVDTLSMNISKMETQYNSTQASLKEVQNTVRDKEQNIRDLNEDIRKRDSRLKEKDDILQQINRKLTEKENQVKDMDNTIRATMQKLKERENDMKSIEKSNRKLQADHDAYKKRADELSQNLDALQKKLQQELATAKSERDDLKTAMAKEAKSKNSLTKEIESMKNDLRSTEKRFKDEKSRLESELRKVREKLHSSTLTQTMKPDDVVRTLSSEKEELIKEKHTLLDEVNQIRKDLNESNARWSEERDDFHKIISEKSKMIDDNNAITERMQEEINKLKVQVSNGSTKLTPIPVIHESSANASLDKDRADLETKLEQQAKIFQAEKTSLEEQYEGKLKTSADQIQLLQQQLIELREENDRQLVLLQSSRMALSDLRSRYDTGLTTWNEEKDHLMQRAEQGDKNTSKVNELQKMVDELKEKLRAAEMHLKEANSGFASEKSAWTAEKSALMQKVKKGSEDAGASAGPASTARPRVTSSVSDFRSKFEKFGPPKTSARSNTQTSVSSVLADTKMIDKSAYEESQKVVKDLQQQIKDVEKHSKLVKDDLTKQLDQLKKEKEKERREYKDRNFKLEKQVSGLSEAEKKLVDLQYQVAQDKETWMVERSQLQAKVNEVMRQQIEEKDKRTAVLAELKKIKELTPHIGSERASSRDSGHKREKTSQGRDSHPGATVIKVMGSQEGSAEGTSNIKQTVDKALARISRLLEETSSIPKMRTKTRPSAPPAFRRSQSMSEVEIDTSQPVTSYPNRSIILSMGSYSSRQEPPSPTQDSTSRTASRTLFRRTVSTQESDSGSVDRQTAVRNVFQPRPHRGSYYQSGTQSAYGSRDASPDKLGKPKKTSPYPIAPPSMIISPSMTPKRAPSVERDVNALTERDMQKLYAKLGQIDTEPASRSVSRERGRGVRLLIKSVSVDSTGDESPNWVPSYDSYSTGDPSPLRQPGSASSERKQPTYGVIAKMHSGLFEDAPLSQTLPASIRLGKLVITPGIESLTTKKKSRRTRSESVSPRTARKTFYDNYPKDKSGFSAIGSRSDLQSSSSRPRLDSSSSEISVDQDIQISISKPEPKPRGRARVSRYDSDIEDTETKTSTKSSFSAADLIRSVKSKRKLFSIKRSASVEPPHVSSPTYMAGVQALSAGAPTGFEPPMTDDEHQVEGTKEKKKKDKKEKKEKKKSKDKDKDKEEKAKSKEDKEKKKKEKNHKRAVSVDLTLISSAPDTPGLVSTIFKDKKKTSKKHGTVGSELQKKIDDAEPRSVNTLPLSKARKPPTRWLSAKKAFEERPIVLQNPDNDFRKLMNSDNHKLNVSHFSETPV